MRVHVTIRMARQRVHFARRISRSARFRALLRGSRRTHVPSTAGIWVTGRDYASGNICDGFVFDGIARLLARQSLAADFAHRCADARPAAVLSRARSDRTHLCGLAFGELARADVHDRCRGRNDDVRRKHAGDARPPVSDRQQYQGLHGCDHPAARSREHVEHQPNGRPVVATISGLVECDHPAAAQYDQRHRNL